MQKILQNYGSEPCANITVVYNGFTQEAQKAFQAGVDNQRCTRKQIAGYDLSIGHPDNATTRNVYTHNNVGLSSRSQCAYFVVLYSEHDMNTDLMVIAK